MARLPRIKNVLTFARSLRKSQTCAESLLWKEIRSRRFAGFKFRRQQPIGPYIVDFCCFESKITIEIDGGSHAAEDAVEYDRLRTEYFRSLGLRELRFWNSDVFDNLEGTLLAIEQALSNTP